jgi:hypothetical protein
MSLNVVDSVVATQVSFFKFLLTLKLRGQVTLAWVSSVGKKI